MDYRILITESSPDYELLDSGDGQKYERFGKITLVRPDPQALWKSALKESDWLQADGRFTQSGASGTWKIAPGVPKEWTIELQGISFNLKPTSSKHIGVFPEHVSHWKWIRQSIKEAGRPISALNLFGYTGGATLAAASAGAEVCHVDASKASVSSAKANALSSGLEKAPIRWIVDDAIAFLKREIKRGKRYDAIVMDPPSFGRGPKGEVWKIEERFTELLRCSVALLSEKPLFILINGYASGYSALGYQNALKGSFSRKAKFECGELTIRDKSGRLLPAGIFARAIF